MSIVYFRDLSPERVATTSSRQGQELARRSWLVMLREWRRRRRSRATLALLDARMLKDIGVTYFDAQREANKPFWLP